MDLDQIKATTGDYLDTLSQGGMEDMILTYLYFDLTAIADFFASLGTIPDSGIVQVNLKTGHQDLGFLLEALNLAYPFRFKIKDGGLVWQQKPTGETSGRRCDGGKCFL